MSHFWTRKRFVSRYLGRYNGELRIAVPEDDLSRYFMLLKFCQLNTAAILLKNIHKIRRVCAQCLQNKVLCEENEGKLHHDWYKNINASLTTK